MPNEIVTVEYNGEVLDLEVPQGASDAQIQSFLTGGEPAEPERGAFDTFARSTGEPFNRGAAGLLDLPVTLLNAVTQGIFALDEKIATNVFGREPAPSHENPPQLTRPFTEAGRKIGAIAPPEEQLHGAIPTGFEFLGAGTVPAAATLRAGSKLLPLAKDLTNASSKVVARELSRRPQPLVPVQTALNSMVSSVATAPGKATAFDIAASFGASTAGEVAKGFTDNETAVAMAQLLGGFTPTLAVLAPSLLAKTPVGRTIVNVTNNAKETLQPFGPGAKVSASKRLSEIAGEPTDVLAKRIDVESKVPPAQQTGDPGLVKLQNTILKRNPKMANKFSEELDASITALKAGGDFGGDIERARHILNVRGQMAVEEAADAVSKLGPNATPRQISVAARKATMAALDDAEALESIVWGRIDETAPADVVNARNTMAEIVQARSLDADPNDIPKWLLQKLNQSPVDKTIMDGLVKNGLVDADGVIDPAVMAALERQGALKTRQRNFKDIKTIRSRILHESRAERAKDGGGSRTKLGILGRIQGALLDDMEATGLPGVTEARSFSRELNNKFRSGRVGRLLGVDRTGAEKVAGEDLLQEVIYGPKSATTTQLLNETASQNPELALDFIRAKYVESVVTDGVVNPTAHDAFLKNLRGKGVFEVFPELEGQLTKVRASDAAARELAVPDSHVNTTRLNQHQSRAALMLQAEPGSEMKLILRSNNPKAAMRDIVSKIISSRQFDTASKKSAIQGLKTSFKEELFNLSHSQTKTSSGELVPDGLNMKRLLTEYRPAMRALQMTDAEIGRLNVIAEKLARMQVSTANVEIGDTILNKPLNAYIDFFARIAGARTGSKLGKGTVGAPLVLAQFMSRTTRERIQKLTTSQAEQLLIDAADDPILYKSLLVGPTATLEQKRQAARAIELALASSSITGIATATSEDEE